MNTYAKLQDGRIMIIVGENSKEETYDLRDIDIATLHHETVPYDYIVNIDTNLAII